MPDEPSAPHPLEVALRAQAARRRADLDAGRPAELPGPVRAALLREVERGAIPAREERGHSTPWWWRWQTLLATTACVLLAVGIFRREMGSPPTAVEKVSPPVASAPPPTEDQRTGAGPAEATREKEAVPPPEPAVPRAADLAVAPPITPVVPPAGAAGRAFAERPVPLADEQPAPPVPASPAIRLEPPAPPGRPAASAPAVSTDALRGAAKPAAIASQRFLQTPLQQTLRSARAVGSSPVLTDFTLRREGDTLVIREGDGSEYRGPLGVAKGESSNTDAFKKDAARRSAAANERSAAAGQPVAFRAIGVNQTLKQTVIIEGVLQPATAKESPAAAAPAARSKAAAAPVPAKPEEALSRASSPSRASIRGRALISGREYAVEAEETGPPPAAR